MSRYRYETLYKSDFKFEDKEMCFGILITSVKILIELVARSIKK